MPLRPRGPLPESSSRAVEIEVVMVGRGEECSYHRHLGRGGVSCRGEEEEEEAVVVVVEEEVEVK